MLAVNFKTLFRRLAYNAPAPVYFLPGEVFFVQFLAVPNVSLEERVALSRFALEESSPFPIEQLAWGVYAPKEAEGVLIYAASRERLRQMGHKLPEGALYVLPDFFAAFSQVSFFQRTVRFFCDGVSFSTLIFEPGHLPPRYIQSVHLDPALPREEAISSVYKEAFEYYQGLSYKVEEGYLKVKAVHPKRNGDFLIETKRVKVGEARAQGVALAHYADSTFLWAADLRDEAFKVSENRKRLLDKRLSCFLSGLVFLSLFLFFAECVLLIGRGVLHLRQRQLEEQLPAVELALENERLLDHIYHVYEHNLDPFKMLDLLNQLRPQGLYFTHFYAEDATHGELKGIGASVDQVNEYGAILSTAEDLVSAHLSDVQTRQGKVQFLLKLVFKAPPQDRFLDLPEEDPEAVEQAVQKEDPRLEEGNQEEVKVEASSPKPVSSESSSQDPLSPVPEVPKANDFSSSSQQPTNAEAKDSPSAAVPASSAEPPIL